MTDLKSAASSNSGLIDGQRLECSGVGDRDCLPVLSRLIPLDPARPMGVVEAAPDPTQGVCLVKADCTYNLSSG